MYGLTTELPIIYSLFCIFIGIVYAYLLYRDNKFDNKILSRLLFVLRLVIVSVLVFLLLNPFISNISTHEEKPIVVLAQDVSISCGNSEDSIFFASLSDQLSIDFEVVEYNYSEDISKGFLSEKKGESTDISNLLDQVELKYSGRNLLAIVASSDGLYNKGSNPLYHKFSNSVPIYSIALGDTSVFKDVNISNVLHNEISFLDNISPIEVQIKTEKCKGERLFIKLFSDNKLIQTNEVKVLKSSDFIKTSFKLKNSEVGLQKYSVEVSGITSERYLENNMYNFFVEVLDSKYKILIVSDVIHPDIGAFKSVLDKNKNYEVDLYSFADLESSFKEYNLIVTFYIENKNSRKLDKIKNSGVPVLMFVNSKSVSLLSSLYSPGKISSKNKVQEAMAFYNSNFKKFNTSSSLQSYLSELPPLSTIFGEYSLSKSADVLAFQKIGILETKKPLVVLDETTERKIAIIYGEGIWRWKINDRVDDNFHQNFDELFSKISQYLLIKDDKSRFRVNVDNKLVEGNNLSFKAEYYNENYELNNTEDVSLKIKKETGEEFDYMFSKDENSTYFLNVKSLSEGEYFFAANYNSSEFVKEGEFTIFPRIKEGIVNTANHQILYQLSSQSGGEMFDNFDVETIYQSLLNNSRNKIILHSTEKTDSILNNVWILFLTLLFISIEWILRKYNGFY